MGVECFHRSAILLDFYPDLDGSVFKDCSVQELLPQISPEGVQESSRLLCSRLLCSRLFSFWAVVHCWRIISSSLKMASISASGRGGHRAEAVQVVVGHVGGHHLDGATGEPEHHLPERIGASPLHDLLGRLHQDSRPSECRAVKLRWCVLEWCPVCTLSPGAIGIFGVLGAFALTAAVLFAWIRQVNSVRSTSSEVSNYPVSSQGKLLQATR